MEFRILGPLEVRDGDRTIPLAGGRQRALLALLILNANETVSTDRLVEELWGEHAPATAPKAVQNHVSHLRRTLEGEPKDAHEGLLVTRGSGYALHLDPGSLDLNRFEQLLEEGRRALARKDAQEASETLREALALWRGPPLADFTFESFAQTEIARLEERRLVGLEERIEADLALGRHADLVGELEALSAKYPLRERLRGQLMLALYRSDRQSEALRVYQESRRMFVDELGIEPGPRLRQLERAILEQDSALDLPRPVGAPLVASASVEEPRHDGGRLIGRERELAALLEGLEGALSGRGRLLLIAGEPGIGKSRLADELAEHARRRRAVTLFGRAWEAGGAPAYWPWVQAIRSYVRGRDAETVRDQLGSGAADVAQMLPELRQLLPEVGAPPSLDPEGARFRLFDATTSFLQRAAEGNPVLLVLDDLHAVDTPSLLLLEFLAQQLAEMRMFVLGTYRDTEAGPEHPLTEALTELARHMAPPLKLTGLPEADVARFIEANQGIEPPRGLAAAIHRETEGNPFFVGEILRLLAAEGRLQETVEPPLGRLRIPASVRDVIGHRLRHLSDGSKGVLTLASVLGREFRLDALMGVSGQELESLLELLDEAISARVVGDVPGAHDRLRFEHVLIRDALYDDLTATRRIRLHRQVGEVLEALYANDPEPHLAELAHHFCEAVPAGETDKAVRYARRAGDRAATLLAYEEAARLYALGLETMVSNAAGNELDRCELLLRLGDVQGRVGDTPAAKKAFLRAAEAARTAGAPHHLARAALGYGGRFVWSRAWGDRQLVPLLEEALRCLPKEDSELRVRLLARLSGGPLRDTLPPEPRVAMSQEAVDMARRLGNGATLAYALDGRCSANWGPEVLSERLAIADELIQVAENVGDTERRYAGHDYRFHALLESGDMPAAYGQHEALARLAHELRQPAQLWDVTVDRAKLALFEGRFEDAERDICEAVELGRIAQSANAQMAFDLQMYALRREQGRLREVLEVVERAVDDYSAYPIWRYVLADVFAELERRDDARAAIDVLAGDGFSVYLEMQWLFSIDLLPEVCRYLGDVEQAEILYELLRPYARLNASTPPDLCRGSVSRGLGILAAEMSRWHEAVKHFECALRMNAEMGARPWLAHAQYDFGRMLMARGESADRERAREFLASAKALSQELGMEALSEKVSALSTASSPRRRAS
ncbi:MAG TPA: BTAD domain-containing putative transcriptional regulator [Gaiellaceae bacterium]|nr:BTAD domain-containing putative transcriptional regulator [Gaiellaceae bacterium]